MSCQRKPVLGFKKSIQVEYFVDNRLKTITIEASKAIDLGVNIIIQAE